MRQVNRVEPLYNLLERFDDDDVIVSRGRETSNTWPLSSGALWASSDNNYLTVQCDHRSFSAPPIFCANRPSYSHVKAHRFFLQHRERLRRACSVARAHRHQLPAVYLELRLVMKSLRAASQETVWAVTHCLTACFMFVLNSLPLLSTHKYTLSKSSFNLEYLKQTSEKVRRGI